MEALQARAIASGLLIGTYERHDTTVDAGKASQLAGAASA
jgi:hypothetical protein